MNAKLCKALRAAARSMSPNVERVYQPKVHQTYTSRSQRHLPFDERRQPITIRLHDCQQAAYKYLKRQARLSGAKS